MRTCTGPVPAGSSLCASQSRLPCLFSFACVVGAHAESRWYVCVCTRDATSVEAMVSSWDQQAPLLAAYLRICLLLSLRADTSCLLASVSCARGGACGRSVCAPPYPTTPTPYVCPPPSFRRALCCRPVVEVHYRLWLFVPSRFGNAAAAASMQFWAAPPSLSFLSLLRRLRMDV